MRSLHIAVECYAGYRREDTPRRFRLQEGTFEVDVIDQWLASDTAISKRGRPTASCVYQPARCCIRRMGADAVYASRRRLQHFRCAGKTDEMLRMKEPHDEGLANHIISESCVARPQGRRRSVDRRTRGLGIEPRNPLHLQGADAVEISGRPHRDRRSRQTVLNPARSETPSTRGRISPGNREVPCLPWRTPRPHREV